MQYLEKAYGREVFDPFLRGYFDHFAFQSIPTSTFRKYLQENLIDKHPGKVTMAQVDQWLYEPGIPADAPKTDSAKFDAVDKARTAWIDSKTLPDKAATSKWSTQEWVHFVEGLPDTMSEEQLKALDAAYKFTGTPNGEIAMRWYPLTVKNNYTVARPEIAKFLERVGRRKLIMPTYGALVKTPDGLAFAKEVFAKAKPGYHPITTGSVESVIADAEKGTTK
jgi:hypothetical protein